MSEVKEGLFWHIHHESLVEWSYNIEERKNYIRVNKIPSEIPIRLRLMQPVKGRLPKDIRETVRSLGLTYNEMVKAQRDFRAAAAVIESQLPKEAWMLKHREYLQARDIWLTKQSDVDNLHQHLYHLFARHKRALESLHRKECADCPWDGRTIFPDSLI